jgi:hypothetical protein
MGGQYDGRLILTGLVPDGVTGIGLPLRNDTTITAAVTSNSFDIDTVAPDGSYEDAPSGGSDPAARPHDDACRLTPPRHGVARS